MVLAVLVSCSECEEAPATLVAGATIHEFNEDTLKFYINICKHFAECNPPAKLEDL